MKNYKTGYSFSPVTGEFITEEIVYLEKRTGDYPHADNVTFIAPPKVNEHQKQVWNGNGWDILPDFRGVIYFNEDGQMIGQIKELGSTEGKILLPPPKLKDHEKVKFNSTINDWEIYLEKNFIRDKDGTIRDMTQVEKIEAGLETIPEGMKIENNELVPKTRDDLFNEGKLTVEEYNKQVDMDRQGRYQMETDKMAFMYLRGECTLEDWKAAMDKIRAELPKK